MTQAYPYIHPEPFSRVLRFDYADCQSNSFMQAWKETREALKKKLNEATSKDPQPPLSGEGTPLITLLQKSRDDTQILWALLKKYEIFGRLHCHYDINLRKAPNAHPASIQDYITLAEILAHTAQKEIPLQYCSTLLKIMDAFCGLDINTLTQAEASRILILIDEEEQFIERLDTCSK